MYQQIIDRFIQQEALPEAYRQDIADWFLPLLPPLIDKHKQQTARPLLVGVNGAQGTGKSTLASLLVQLCSAHELRAVALSIDDFYLGKSQRGELARRIHPLLATRGVPGTHDVQCLQQTLHQLNTASTNDSVPLPAFNKATDDCTPAAQWRHSNEPVDLIFLEGWFMGALPQTEAELQSPVNALEQFEDPEKIWRGYVNTQLGLGYQQVFASFDVLVMLHAPGFEQVLEWRNLQEEKLRQKAGNPSAGMQAAQIVRFIQHFERLTRHCLQTVTSRADIVFDLDAAHRVVSSRSKL